MCAVSEQRQNILLSKQRTRVRWQNSALNGTFRTVSATCGTWRVWCGTWRAFHRLIFGWRRGPIWYCRVSWIDEFRTKVDKTSNLPREAIEKWAAAAAAAAGNKNGGILWGWCGGGTWKWGWGPWSPLECTKELLLFEVRSTEDRLLRLLGLLEWDTEDKWPSFWSFGLRGPRSCWTANKGKEIKSVCSTRKIIKCPYMRWF